MESPAPTAVSLVQAYPVDPLFQDFYAYLGGEAVLGLAISPAIPMGNMQSQYLESALMLYDPMATESDRFKLAPLGVYLGISEEPVPDPGQPQARYANGHIIFDEFIPFYEQLGGARFVGRPLTEARHNPAKQRIEQYFENLGFYHLQSDPPGQVRLIAYGAYSCDQRCRHQSPAASIPSLHGVLPGPFARAAAFLGLGFTGLTLSEPYRNPDGQLEVIFQNLVMVLEPEAAQAEEKGQGMLSLQLLLPAVFLEGLAVPGANQEIGTAQQWVPLVLWVGQSSASVAVGEPLAGAAAAEEMTFSVSFKPIVELLGIPRQPPVEGRNDPLLVFYPAEDGKGYHVPTYFDQYLQRYGGSRVTGEPIGEVFPLEGGVFRQCFTNLCLDFDPAQPAGRQLRPAPLGAEYQASFRPPAGGIPDGGGTLQLEVWEEQAYVSPREGPLVRARLSRAGLPLGGQALSLTLTLPDNSQREYSMPPTDRQGETAVQMPAIEAPNGTLVPYRVCATKPEGSTACAEDHYLIWDYP